MEVKDIYACIDHREYWYHIDFKLGLGRPFDGYLWNFAVEDKAGNGGYYNCRSQNQTVSCVNQNNLSLPLIPIRLVP